MSPDVSYASDSTVTKEGTFAKTSNFHDPTKTCNTKMENHTSELNVFGGHGTSKIEKTYIFFIGDIILRFS